MPQKKQIKNNMRKHMSTYKRNSPMKSAGEILSSKGFQSEPELTDLLYNANVDLREADKNVVDPKQKDDTKIGSSANEVKLAADPRAGAIDTFSAYDLRSAWKGAKMAARKEAKASIRSKEATRKEAKATKAKTLSETAKELSNISKTQIKEKINPRLTARVKSPAMKMLFKK